MLHCALIGLDAGKSQSRSGLDRLCQNHHVRHPGHAAAPRAAIDLDQAFNLCAMSAGGIRQIGDIGRIIDATGRAGTEFRQPRQPVDLHRIAHLVGHQHIRDAAAHEGFRLRDLLAADADGSAKPLLQFCHIHRFVHLAMRPEPYAHRAGPLAHLDDVALQRIEIEHQARRLDICLAHAGQGRHIVADLEAAELVYGVHAVLLNRPPGLSAEAGLAGRHYDAGWCVAKELGIV